MAALIDKIIIMQYKVFENGQFTGEGEIPTDLLPEEETYYDARAKALAEQLVVTKVHAVVQIEPGTRERRVCFLREPNYPTKIRVMDKANMFGPYTAAEELREMSVIKESSDAITYSESPESDRYKLGVVDYCLGMITRLQNAFKKK